MAPVLGGPRSSGAPVHWTAWTPGSYATVATHYFREVAKVHEIKGTRTIQVLRYLIRSVVINLEMGSGSVTFPQPGGYFHSISLPFGQYQIKLPCDRGRFVNKLPTVIMRKSGARSRINDLHGHEKSWNLARPFSRPEKSWKIAEVMESHGKWW